MRFSAMPAKALIVALVMVCTAVVAEWAKPSKRLVDVLGKPDLETLFPREFGSWRVDPGMSIIQPSPDVQAKLESIYSQVLSRTYVNAANERVMLSVAYGGDQSNGTRAHRPEACYPAQGFSISHSAQDAVQVGARSLPVRHLMAALGGRQEPITYWVVVGNQSAVSHWQQRQAELSYSLKGYVADGLLVRVSTISADRASGYRTQTAFLGDLWAALSPAQRSRVFGEVSVQ